MTDDDRDLEVSRKWATDEGPTDTGIDEESTDRVTEPPPDDAVDTFLELESELAATDAATNPRDDTRPSGLVVGAETTSAEEVPDSYPLTVQTDLALELQLVLRDGERTIVYLDWPKEDGIDTGSTLGRLLAALDVSGDEFADLYGETLLLEREGRHYTVLIPSEPPRGSGNWEIGVVGGVAFNVAVLGLFGLAAAGLPVGGLVSALLLPFVVVNLFFLPWATYRDATYLRTHSDWSQGPPFWGALSMLPVINVAVSAFYLWSRSRARFLGTEPSLKTKLLQTVRKLV